jgi:hypothetical protein
LSSRVEKFLDRLKYPSNVKIKDGEHGPILCREDQDEDAFWELELYEDGRFGISMDWVGRSDTRVIKVLKAIGEILGHQ